MVSFPGGWFYQYTRWIEQSLSGNLCECPGVVNARVEQGFQWLERARSVFRASQVILPVFFWRWVLRLQRPAIVLLLQTLNQLRRTS